MRSICLNFEINHISYVNDKLSAEEVHANIISVNDVLIEEYYSKVNEILVQISSEFGSLFKYSISISKDTLVFYNANYPEFIDSLKRLNHLSVSFNQCFTSLNSLSNRTRLQFEILDHTEIVFDILGRKCSNILFDYGLLNTELLQNLDKNKTFALLSNLKTNESLNYIVNVDEIDNAKLLITDSDFQSNFIDSNVDLVKLLKDLNAKPEDTEVVSLNINYSDFVDNDSLFNKLKSFPEMLMSESNFSFIWAKEAIDYSGNSRIVKESFNIANNLSNVEVKNNSSKQLLTNIENISYEISNCKDIEVSSQWQYLSSINTLRSFEIDVCNLKALKKIDKSIDYSKYIVNTYTSLASDIKLCIEDVEISDSRIRFSELEKMPKLKLKKLLAGFDAKTIFLSIQNQNAELKDKVLSNIPYKLLDEVEELMGNSTFSNVEIRNARRRIISKLKKMYLISVD